MIELFGLELSQIAIAFVANLVVGGVFVLAVYKTFEMRIAIGIISSLVLGAIIIWMQATVGQTIWTFNFEQRRNIIVVAGIGAALGIVGTMSILKPEIE